MPARLKSCLILFLWLFAALPALAQENSADALRHLLELRGEIV
jgi:hypothetical protein